jgi:hypothetical protein
MAPLICFMAPPAQAQLKGENLLVGMPAGFTLGFQGSRNGVNLQEWVRVGETVENWSEMLTVQIFLNRRDLDPVEMLRRIEEGWLGACKGSPPAAAQSDKVNGYGAAMILLHCPLLARTGKPETTLFRAIRGNDSFYMVQRAVRAVPTPEQLEAMRRYLAAVSVCDARSAAHPCPGVGPTGTPRAN